MYTRARQIMRGRHLLVAVLMLATGVLPLCGVDCARASAPDAAVVSDSRYGDDAPAASHGCHVQTETPATPSAPADSRGACCVDDLAVGADHSAPRAPDFPIAIAVAAAVAAGPLAIVPARRASFDLRVRPRSPYRFANPPLLI